MDRESIKVPKLPWVTKMLAVYKEGGIFVITATDDRFIYFLRWNGSDETYETMSTFPLIKFEQQ